MAYFRKSNRKKPFKLSIAIVLLIAVALGSLIGLLLPSDLPILSGSSTNLKSIEEISGKVQVVDGDTIKISGITIRLFGIDAPEAKQKCLDGNSTAWNCGTKSTELLKSLVENKHIRCVSKDVDQYGRVVAVCTDENLNINALMVSNGMAVAYRNYSTEYIDEEDAAKSASIGVWAGKFEYPWNWRGINRYKTNKVVTNGCNIKGNISSRGVKIYHVPSGEYYSETQINPTKGEKWFCSEKEAKQAGWRRSKV